MKKKLVIIFLIIGLPFANICAQKPYFVDGYHGGIYGHYPMWVTQFMVDKLDEHPEWRIGLEIEPETWDTVKVNEPQAYINFQKMATDKRIEFTNPSYAQPYCYNISGESIIRQMEYGIKKTLAHFPNVKFTTYSAEEPCFTSSLPLILKQFGFEYAVLKCPNTLWGGYTKNYGGELVNWIGPNGTSILTVPRYEAEELENSTWQTKAWNNSMSFIEASYASGIENPAGMCYQDAGWKNGPWLGHGENIKNKSTYTTWKEYIEEISTGKTKDNYFFSQEDMLVNLMWGSQVMQRIAQQVRSSENAVIMAEKMSTMANIDNSYLLSQENMDEAWRTLMMAQHHDSWIVPYNGLKKDATWADAIKDWTDATNRISKDIIQASASSFSSNFQAAGNSLGYLRVFNTVGVERNEVVKVALPKNMIGKMLSVYDASSRLVNSSVVSVDGIPHLIIQSQTPSFGYATYEIKEKKEKEEKALAINFDKNGNCTIESSLYSIKLDASKGGAITSLILKKEGNKQLATVGGKYLLGEIVGHFYEDKKFYSSKENSAKISVVENTSLSTKIKIEGTIATHPYTQILSLTKDGKMIDFDLDINWKSNVGIGEYKQEGSKWSENRRAYTDDRYKLRVMFPVDLSTPKLFKNAPFDVCESKLEDTFFGQWDEIKHNIILNWVDLIDQNEKYGLALFSDHTTSYGYGNGEPLSLTAQYSGIGLWGMDYKITEATKIKYALVPHTQSWEDAKISTQSNLWNEPLVSQFYSDVKLENKSYVELGQSGYEISSMKVDGDQFLIRLFNAEGDDSKQMVRFNFPVSQIDEVQLDGKHVASKTIETNNGANSVSVAMPRFEFQTLSILK